MSGKEMRFQVPPEIMSGRSGRASTDASRRPNSRVKMQSNRSSIKKARRFLQNYRQTNKDVSQSSYVVGSEVPRRGYWIQPLSHHNQLFFFTTKVLSELCPSPIKS